MLNFSLQHFAEWIGLARFEDVFFFSIDQHNLQTMTVIEILTKACELSTFHQQKSQYTDDQSYHN